MARLVAVAVPSALMSAPLLFLPLLQLRPLLPEPGHQAEPGHVTPATPALPPRLRTSAPRSADAGPRRHEPSLTTGLVGWPFSVGRFAVWPRTSRATACSHFTFPRSARRGATRPSTREPARLACCPEPLQAQLTGGHLVLLASLLPLPGVAPPACRRASRHAACGQPPPPPARSERLL